MENNFQNNDKYAKAVKKVEDIKGFYGNLASYIFVNIGLLVLNLTTSPNHLWFYWPLLGWGIGVVFHAANVFDLVPFLGKTWEEKQIKKIMDSETSQQTKFN